MKNLKTFEQHIKEGKHGEFEIIGVKDNDEIDVIDYATTEESAKALVKKHKGDFKKVYYKK